MSKAPAVAAAAAAAAPAPLFKIETGEAPPAIERKVGAAASPYADFMKTMPAPTKTKTGMAFSQFFIPAEVPPTITDAAEKAKVAKEEARKISNRLSGITRRLTKADATLAFALRTREEGGVLGVRVYRVEPEPATA